MLTGEASDWSDERNRLIAVGLTILESETCSCGTPTWIGHSTNRDIAFKVESATCFGCAEIEKDREEREKNKRKPSRGEKRYPSAYNVWEGEPLPSRRASYEAEAGK